MSTILCCACHSFDNRRHCSDLETAIIRLDQVRTFLGNRVRRRHDITGDVAWENRSIDNTQVVHTLHLELIVRNFTHRT